VSQAGDDRGRTDAQAGNRVSGQAPGPRPQAGIEHRTVERHRQAIYGAIVLLSVLVVLSETSPSAVDAALGVAGTAFVLFFAHVYAGGLAERSWRGRALDPGDFRRLMDESWPVVAVTLWPLVLLGLAGLGLIHTTVALELGMWLAVAALGLWSWTAGRRMRLSTRLLSTVLSLVVGLAIVALKIAFH